MSDLLIGTDRGVFRLNADGSAQREEGRHRPLSSRVPTTGAGSTPITRCRSSRLLAGDLPTVDALSFA